MTEEPMTQKEITVIISGEEQEFLQSGASTLAEINDILVGASEKSMRVETKSFPEPDYSLDFVRENAMRHAIESMRGLEPHNNRMVEVLYRAEAIYKFLKEKSS